MSYFDQYLESRVLSASPVELVRMMYRGTLQATATARQHFSSRDIASRTRALNQAVALMREGQVIDVTLNLTLSAAASGLPMADSLIYATAQAHHAILWTQDSRFKYLPGVNYLPKNNPA